MIALKMNIGPVSTGFDGKESLEVNGNRLTIEQLLEIDKAGELTSWGIAEYFKKHKAKNKSDWVTRPQSDGILT